MTEENNKKREPKHHKQQELCTTRPPYRQGRKFTAVKAYTIANESQHLFVYGVPTINLRSELKNLFLKYGQILALHVVTDYKTERFTECYHVHYAKIQSARIAKHKLDNKSFYGGILHVCYAPEKETVDDTRAKLLQRSKDVLSRLYGTLEKDDNAIHTNSTGLQRKRKNPAIEINEERLQNIEEKEIWAHIPTELDPREPKNKISKMAQPVKHYQISQAQPATELYGPQLPTYYQSTAGNVAAVNKNVEKKIIFHNQ